jgi:hypothetical protein
MSECSICIDTFNKSTRKLVKCPGCYYKCCRECYQRQILSKNSIECMNCNIEWSNEHINSQFTNAFLNDTGKWKGKGLRTHQESILLLNEKPFIQDTIQMIKHEEHIYSLQQKSRNILDSCLIVSKSIKQMNKCRLFKCICKRGINKCICISDDERNEWLEEFNQLNDLLIEMEEDAIKAYTLISASRINGFNDTKQNNKSFIQRCMKDDCEGYLSTRWKCQVCDTITCNRCREVKDEGHICNEETVKTIQMCIKESKPCPKCSEPISKINGCDQMWCSLCETIFSWNTGKIQIGGLIHQPDAVRKMRERGFLERDQRDIQCGGIPHRIRLLNKCIKNFTENQKRHIEILITMFARYGIEYEHYFMQFGQVPTGFTRHILSRKQFLKGNLTEIEWKKQLYIKEKSYLKQEEQKLILGGWYICFSDLIRGFEGDNLLTYNDICVHIISICKLMDLYNDLFESNIGKVYGGVFNRISMNVFPDISKNRHQMWKKPPYIDTITIRCGNTNYSKEFFPNIVEYLKFI